MKTENNELDFTKTNDQIYYCPWRKKERTMRYAGRCAVCGKRTYMFLDGENDPRGPLGDHANSSIEAPDFEKTGPDIIACFNCANDERTYKRLMQIADKKWKDK